jgi:hypothetical protein
VIGLSSGHYEVSARGFVAGPGSAQLLSEMVRVAIDEDATPAVTLVLRHARSLNGRVVTPSGVGVPGATVVALPAELPHLPSMPVQTDADGRFSATLPPGTAHVVSTSRRWGPRGRAWGDRSRATRSWR